MNVLFRKSTLLIVALSGALSVALIPARAWSVMADDDNSSKPTAASTDQPASPANDTSEDEYVPKSRRALQKKLTRIQFDVTQNEATEPAFRNKYWNNKATGVYQCVVCGRDLFRSTTKYKSGTGWPSFYAPVSKKNVGLRVDKRLFYDRTEVHCSRCDSHLGHVFDDGPKPTGKRYCMNSASLRFVKQKPEKKSK